MLTIGKAAGIFFLIVIPIVFVLPPAWKMTTTSDNDFEAFYVSGQLVLQGRLYNTQTFQSVEQMLSPDSTPLLLLTRQAVRPPFFALAFWPLAQLPYRVASVIWAVIILGAVLGFVWLWPDRLAATIACCWSLGISGSVCNGQDVPVILIWLAIALRIWKKHPFLAGLLFALCATKFHMFLFLPLLLWRHKLWRGFLAGGAGLATVSFAACGWHWPQQYIATLKQDAIAPSVQKMPNVHGLVASWSHAGVWEMGISLFIAILVVGVVYRADLRNGLAMVLLGGLLVSHHAYIGDCVLLLPAILIIMRNVSNWCVAHKWSIVPVICLLLPLSNATIFFGLAGEIFNITRLVIIVVLLFQSGWFVIEQNKLCGLSVQHEQIA